MSAHGVTDVLVQSIETRAHQFMLCNLANGDMVGHSGSLPATIQACEVVDACLARVIAPPSGAARGCSSPPTTATAR
jgi:2,3-bisphosphoglycerate-independent phosphoglycerate mutase